MQLQNYALTPIQITKALPRTRPYKLTDGAGLHLVVSPGGTKAWRFQYRYAGVRCDVGIGKFPEIGIADARDQHQRYRSMLERGLDPAVARRQQVPTTITNWQRSGGGRCSYLSGQIHHLAEVHRQLFRSAKSGVAGAQSEPANC